MRFVFIASGEEVDFIRRPAHHPFQRGQKRRIVTGLATLTSFSLRYNQNTCLVAISTTVIPSPPHHTTHRYLLGIRNRMFSGDKLTLLRAHTLIIGEHLTFPHT